ncbi:MAG: hypothetical protein ACI86H_002918 [bacterium]|jgi:hypothetical protein
MKRSYIYNRNSIITGILLLLTLLVGGCDSKKNIHNQLNGSWTNPIMVIKIDFDKGTYSGTALGSKFSKKLTLVSEKGSTVVFKSGESKIICLIQKDGSIILTKEGGIPIPFTRVKA